MPPLRAAVNLTCPSCGEPLPTLPITCTAGRFATRDGKWEVRLQADPDDQWWAEVNERHIECVLL